MGNQELFFGQMLEVDDVVDIVEQVKTDDVERVARDIFIMERLNMAVVGPTRSQEKLKALLTL